jgi:hypothetical protein
LYPEILIEGWLFLQENLVIGKEKGMDVGVNELLVAENIHQPEPVIFRFNPID